MVLFLIGIRQVAPTAQERVTIMLGRFRNALIKMALYSAFSLLVRRQAWKTSSTDLN